MAEWLVNANSITTLILSIFSIITSIIAAVAFLKNKVLKKQIEIKNKLALTDFAREQSAIANSLTFLEWISIIPFSTLNWITWGAMGRAAKGEKIFSSDTSTIDFLVFCTLMSLLLFFCLSIASALVAALSALLMWAVGVVDVWKSTGLIFSLSFISFTLASWLYRVGKQAEEKVLEKSNATLLSRHAPVAQAKSAKIVIRPIARDNRYTTS